jgi:hypothetical protein
MQWSEKLNAAIFGFAVLDLVVILECLWNHVPATYASNSLVALVEILFVSLMGFDLSRVQASAQPVSVSKNDPAVEGAEEVSKRIEHFGLDGEHPSLTRADWMRAIANDQTQDSYWEWVTKNEMQKDKRLNQFKGLELLRPRAQNR